MSNFFDAVFLARFSREKGAHIFKFYPNDFDFLNQKNIFSICSFPESQQDSFFQNDKSKIPTTIYSTTIENKNCYILSFNNKYEHTNIIEPTSIAIVSQKMIAPEIFKLLLDTRAFLFQLLNRHENDKKEAENTTKNTDLNYCNQNQNEEIHKSESIPERILDEVWKCVQLCTFDKKTSILTVFTPIRKFKVVLGNEHVTYSQFDPYFWLSSQTNLYIIWRALMTNRCILIVGDSPAQVSCAVFSIISLAAPLKYCEPYIAYTRLGDPRFGEIISDQSRKWKIVGTTNSLLAEQCNQFAVIGKLPPMEGDKYKEIDPDFLQQKFLNNTKSFENYSNAHNRNLNHRNNTFPLNLKKFDFLNLKSFSNSFNSIFSLQLNEAASSDHSQSSFAMSTENLSRSMCCNSLRKATKKMMTLIEFRLNNKIEYDPYFDILSKDLLEEDFYGIFIPSSSMKNRELLESESKNQQNDNKNNLSNKIKRNINDSINQNSLINPKKDNDELNIYLHQEDEDNNDNENLLCSNFDYFDIKYTDSRNINDNDDNEFNDTDEIDVDAIANEFSLPPSSYNQIGKMRNKTLMKSKLFNNIVPSSKASKISSFYLNRNKKKHPKIHFFTTKDAMRLKDSLTFKDWRKNITYRSHFRECFLSMMPDEALSERDKEERIKIYNSLVGEISKKYEKDLHMTAVIKRHICLLKNLIGIDDK